MKIERKDMIPQSCDRKILQHTKLGHYIQFQPYTEDEFQELVNNIQKYGSIKVYGDIELGRVIATMEYMQIERNALRSLCRELLGRIKEDVAQETV